MPPLSSTKFDSEAHNSQMMMISASTWPAIQVVGLRANVVGGLLFTDMRSS